MRRLDQSRGPRERQREHAAQVGVRTVVGEPPCARADGRLQHDAWPERVPVGGALLGEPDLARTPRQELVARVSDHADAGDEDVEAIVADRDHPADDALRDASVAGEPLDARRHLRPVRQWDRERVDRREAPGVVAVHS